MDIPPAFWFRQATTLGSAGRHERAVAAATRYLQEAGQDGEHYRLALELLDGSEAALREARLGQDRARAAAERARQEAEVRLQDVLAASPEMVVVPGGAFRMGCLSGKRCWRNEPVRRLRVASFAISKHEVTFGQWDACTRFGGCRKLEDWIMRGGEWRKGWGRGRQPVIYVSWHDAQSYVTWLSLETGEAYRLPTEAGGNTPHVPLPRRSTGGATEPAATGRTATAVGASGAAAAPRPLARSRPTRSASTTCSGTCGSGSRTAQASATSVPRQTAARGWSTIAWAQGVRNASSAGDRGTRPDVRSARRLGGDGPLAISSTTLVSVSPRRCPPAHRVR